LSKLCTEKTVIVFNQSINHDLLEWPKSLKHKTSYNSYQCQFIVLVIYRSGNLLVIHLQSVQPPVGYSSYLKVYYTARSHKRGEPATWRQNPSTVYICLQLHANCQP